MQPGSSRPSGPVGGGLGRYFFSCSRSLLDCHFGVVAKLVYLLQVFLHVLNNVYGSIRWYLFCIFLFVMVVVICFRSFRSCIHFERVFVVM